MKKSPKTARKCRVVVMGASGVGKTSLISQLLGTGCPEKHKETVEEMYHSDLKLSTGSYSLEILDTAGAFSFPAMRRLAITKADVFILVFSLDSPETLQHLKILREEIIGVRENARSKIVVAANKIDLSDECNDAPSNEHVPTLVSLDWDCECVETSARKDFGVLDLFQSAVSLLDTERSPSLSPVSSMDECSREC